MGIAGLSRHKIAQSTVYAKCILPVVDVNYDANGIVFGLTPGYVDSNPTGNLASLVNATFDSVVEAYEADIMEALAEAGLPAPTSPQGLETMATNAANGLFGEAAARGERPPG
jgi:hypothetical protein